MGFDLADLEFLDLPGHRHWERVDKADVLRNLEVGNVAVTESANLVLGGALACFQPDPSYSYLAQAFIGNPDELNFGDFGVRL